MAEEAPSQPTCNFFRKPTAKKNIRKRSSEADDAEDEDSQPSILTSKRPLVAADNKLTFSSARPKPRSTDLDDGADDTGAPSASSAPIFYYESSKEIQVQTDSKATATLETETEFDRDARAIRERQLKQAEEALKGSGGKAPVGGDKLYRGIHGYTDYKAGFRREHTVAGEKSGGAHGPLRASAHIRSSARFDYQPDICKDYKETGYCGFGDACKFMHDRGDYKSGWQLEKDWEEAEKARKRKLAMRGGDSDDDDVPDGEDDDDEDDDGLPFACFICRQPFEDPVVTKCKHYFCEHCALKHHAKNKKCFVCNTPTLGIFNTAHDIKKRKAEKNS